MLYVTKLVVVTTAKSDRRYLIVPRESGSPRSVDHERPLCWMQCGSIRSFFFNPVLQSHRVAAGKIFVNPLPRGMRSRSYNQSRNLYLQNIISKRTLDQNKFTLLEKCIYNSIIGYRRSKYFLGLRCIFQPNYL